MVYNTLLSSWSIQIKSYWTIYGAKRHRQCWYIPTSHLVLTFLTCATLISECVHGTRSFLIFPAFRTQRYMLNFVYCEVLQCVTVYPLSSYHANLSWPNFQTAWSDFKPTLRRVFAEGLDGYDVSRCFGTVTVFRPTLPEIEAGWKPKNAAHEDDDEEEELPLWYPIGRRVRIPDVWYVRSFVSIKKYLCWYQQAKSLSSFVPCARSTPNLYVTPSASIDLIYEKKRQPSTEYLISPVKTFNGCHSLFQKCQSEAQVRILFPADYAQRWTDGPERGTNRMENSIRYGLHID